MPAMKPPALMAVTFTAVRLTPTLCAASSSSPTARSTAPARERSIHHSAAMTRMTNTQTKVVISHASHPFATKYRISRNPLVLSGPTSMSPRGTRQLRLKKNRRTNSLNAMVATTSIKPFTRRAGKPTRKAKNAEMSAAASNAGRMGSSKMTVRIPAE